MTPTGSPQEEGIALIKEAVASGRGALVGLYSGLPTTPVCHAIVVVDFRETEGLYNYVDSNKKEVEFEGKMEWFNQQFMGLVIVLEGPQERP